MHYSIFSKILTNLNNLLCQFMLGNNYRMALRNYTLHRRIVINKEKTVNKMIRVVFLVGDDDKTIFEQNIIDK